MKYFNLLTCSLALVLVWSCSNDDGGSNPESITGTWDAIELRLNEDTATEDELLASDFIEILAAKDCYVLSVSFAANGTATAETSFEYLDLSGLSMGDFDIPCPDQSDSSVSDYTYENGQLTFTDPDGVTSTVDAVISGNTLTMDLDDSVLDDVVADGQLIFRKR
jgi:hypothetical protein